MRAGRTLHAENEYAEASDFGSLVPVDPESCFDTVLEYSLSFADKMGFPLRSST